MNDSTDLLQTIDCANRLLRMLGEAEYRDLLPGLQRLRLQPGEILCQRGDPACKVFFPCNGVLSVVALMRDGTMVETATIGNEGFAGIDVLLGCERWTDTVMCQVECDGLWMPAEAFCHTIAGSGGAGLRRATQRFLVTYLSLVSQSVACNRLHKIEERFARWMLMTRDRVGGDGFYLTQEFISQMLGVHRPSVSTVASAFQQAGLIHYTRGHVSILDRAGLEHASCECYAVCARQIEELLRPPG
jgi:CRP-like cAMP-binding protein